MSGTARMYPPRVIISKRLDDRLIESFGIGSRGEAQGLILAGEVLVNGKPMYQAGKNIKTSDLVHLRRRSSYYSRAALKLKKVVEGWNFPIKGKSFLDVGAAHGGFTQVLLEKEASKVTTLDVSYGQLHPDIRNHKKVSVMERKSLYHLKTSDLRYIPDAFVVDLSFTSLRRALLHIRSVLSSSEGICLLKPQFEVKISELSREDIAQKGVIKNTMALDNIKDDFIHFLKTKKIDCIHWEPSSILGRKGNQEFLFWVRY